MKKSNKTSLELIDNSIAILYAAKEALLSNVPLTEKVKTNDWVIDESTGNPVYFQFINYDGGNDVKLKRKDKLYNIFVNKFEQDFRLATIAEVEQHENYLNKQNKKLPGYRVMDFIKTLSDEEMEILKDQIKILIGTSSKEYFNEQISKINQIGKILSIPAYDSMGSTIPKTDLPDFYMVTVRGLMGTKKRHETYEGAEKEAKRLAKLENHRAHIMGVVAVVDPVVTTELNVTKK